MIRHRLILLLVCGFALVPWTNRCSAQRVNPWRVYRLQDALPESACLAVCVSPSGKVVATHFASPAVSELNGYDVRIIPIPEQARARAYSSPGGQLWMAGSDTLFEYQGGKWLAQGLAAVIPDFRIRNPRLLDPWPLYPIRPSQVLCLLPNRLVLLNTEEPFSNEPPVIVEAKKTGLETFSSMASSRDGGLWISGMRGLLKLPGPVKSLKADASFEAHLLPSALGVGALEDPHEDLLGGVTVLAEVSESHQKVALHFRQGEYVVQTLPNERFRQVFRGPDGAVWGFTIRSLFRAENETAPFQESEEIQARQYFDMAMDPQGSFWLATSEGLFHYVQLAWRTPEKARNLNSLVPCMRSDGNSGLWFICSGALHHLTQSLESFRLPPGMRRPQAIRALHLLPNGRLVIEGEDQLQVFDSATTRFEPALARFASVRALGSMKTGELCVSVRESGNDSSEASLKIFDGSNVKPLELSGPVPFLGAELQSLCAMQNGDLWFAGPRGTALYHEGVWKTFLAPDKSTPVSVVSFVERADGKLFCATEDQLWQFDGTGWMVVRSGFDRINAVIQSRDGSLWIASNSGLFRLFQGAAIEMGPDEGLSSGTTRSLCEDLRGRIFAGTLRGLSEFQPQSDTDPPQTRIRESTGRNVPDETPVNISFSGQDKWKITPRERLLYSHRLDEREWSPFSEVTEVSFTDLTPGKHYFQVRAMDRNGNVDPDPVRHEFAIVLPWYREARSVVIASLGGAVAVFFAALAFNRHRRLVRSYAEVEKKVQARTQELEIANRELLQSQKMTALGTLAAGVAHDFNNILSIIKGSAQIIEENLGNPEKVRIRLDRIRTSVEQGSGLVKAMLGFSRVSDKKLVACDLNGVTEDAIRLLGERFMRETPIRFERHPGLPPARGMQDLIQQILLNLLFNAADAAPRDHRIRIFTWKLKNAAIPPAIQLTAGESLPEGAVVPAELALAPDGAPAYVAVSVQDSGCGIPAGNLPRIFEPFFTTKAFSTRRGTGLGLSMVYELARQMGAGLAVHSVVDHGSTFTLLLPVKSQSPSHTPAGESVPATTSTVSP